MKRETRSDIRSGSRFPVKIDTFYFRWLNKVLKYECTGCRRQFGQVLQVVFDARPGDEWEVSGKCLGCGRDWTKLVKATQVMGSPGNKSLDAFNKDFTEGMKKWMSL